MQSQSHPRVRDGVAHESGQQFDTRFPPRTTIDRMEQSGSSITQNGIHLLPSQHPAGVSQCSLANANYIKGWENLITAQQSDIELNSGDISGNNNNIIVLLIIKIAIAIVA